MPTATTSPVMGWDERVFVASESSFAGGVEPAAAQYMQWYDLDMGVLEQQDTRPVKDKTLGRGYTAQFVSGRVKPIKWKGKTSAKTRAAVDTVPVESAVYQAGGLVETVNTGVSVTYTFNSSPTIIGKTLQIYSVRGAAPYEAEAGIGGVVEEIDWEFIDKEVTISFAGAFAGKNFLGQASATVADGSTTTITLDNAGDAYKIGQGWYFWETEIILITAVNYGANTFTCTRGVSPGPAGSAHSGKNISPYLPTVSAPTSTPISEANATVTIDGVTTRVTKGSVKLKTGLTHLPGESGSVRVQGAKAVRYSLEGEVEYVVTDDTERLIGKMNQRKDCAFVFTLGTGTGAIYAFSIPHTVLKPYAVPAPNNDISVAKMGFMPRDNAGNDMMTITLT